MPRRRDTVRFDAQPADRRKQERADAAAAAAAAAIAATGVKYQYWDTPVSSPATAAEVVDSVTPMTKTQFYELADELRGTAFTIARLNQARTIARFQRALTQILSAGGTVDDWHAWVLQEGRDWSRAYSQIVYRNAAAAATNRAAWSFSQTTYSRRYRRYLMYDAILDDRTTEICRTLDGRVWRRPDFPENLWPPNHHQCRSTIRTITKAVARKLRGSFQEPGSPAPVEPAEGWNGNQARAWAENVNVDLRNAERDLRIGSGR